MNLLEQLPLDKKDQTLLKKIVTYSLVICGLVLVAAWVIPRMGKHAAIQPTSILGGSIGSSGEGAEKLLPIDVEAHEWAADYFVRIDAPQKAIEHLLRILPQKRNDRRTLLQLGSAYLQAQQFPNAYQVFRQLAEQNVADSLADSVNARLGLTLFYLGRTADSKAALEKCLDHGKRSPEAACYLGQVLATIDANAPQGEEYLLKAVEWDESYVEAWYQLARYYMAIGKYEKSRTHLLHVLDLQPLYVKAHSRLGMAYYYLNQPDLAEKSYQTALALNPNDFNTHYNLGELYASLGKTSNALQEYKATLRIDPTHGEANFKVGLICMSNGMVHEAIGYFQAAARQDPHNTRLLFQLAVAYEMSGMRQDALSEYQTVLSFDPLNEIATQKVKMLTGTGAPTMAREKPTRASQESGSATEPAISKADTKTSSHHD